MSVGCLGQLYDGFSNGLPVEHRVCLIGTFVTVGIRECFRIFRWLRMLGHLRHESFECPVWLRICVCLLGTLGQRGHGKRRLVWGGMMGDDKGRVVRGRLGVGTWECVPFDEECWSELWRGLYPKEQSCEDLPPRSKRRSSIEERSVYLLI